MPNEVAPSIASRVRRNPTIAEIAAEAGVGTATVDRILNGRAGVREQTRKRVLKALAHLNSMDAKPDPSPQAKYRIAFLSDSGRSYVDTLESAVWETVRQRSD
ncbi:MAG: LacI family transcriptional regulator, partial [Alphaproteobacteria bacterium]